MAAAAQAKRGNEMRTTLRITLAALLAITAPTALAAKNVDTIFLLEDVALVREEVYQNWTGQDATKFRQSLGKVFGDGNGALNETEADTIVDTARTDLEGRLSEKTYLNGAAGQNADVRIEVEGIAGSPQQTGDVRLRHALTIHFDPGLVDAAAGNASFVFNHTLLGAGKFELTAPAGWHVARVEGLSEHELSRDGRSVAGQGAEGANVKVTVGKGERLTGAEEAGGPSQGRSGAVGPTQVPGPGLALVAALGLLAAVATRRRRR